MKDRRMRLAKLLKALLPTLLPIPDRDTKAAKDAVAHGLVCSYARGNVNLQDGRYMTAEQLEARKQKLAQYSF